MLNVNKWLCSKFVVHEGIWTFNEPFVINTKMSGIYIDIYREIDIDILIFNH